VTGVVIVPGGFDAFRVGNTEVRPGQLLALLGTGRDTAMRASQLAEYLSTTERHIGQLAATLIDEGYLVGSVCSGERPGYFLCATEEDLDVGTQHIRSRALASLKRIATLKATAREVFGDKAATLFDLEEFSR
jgi:hypothetical protein